MNVAHVPLYRLAHSRSGDKGDISNLSLIAWDPACYGVIAAYVTAERVRDWFTYRRPRAVTRYLLPTLHAMNFVLEGAGRRCQRCAEPGRPRQVPVLPVAGPAGARAGGNGGAPAGRAGRPVAFPVRRAGWINAGISPTDQRIYRPDRPACGSHKSMNSTWARPAQAREQTQKPHEKPRRHAMKIRTLPALAALVAAACAPLAASADDFPTRPRHLRRARSPPAAPPSQIARALAQA